MERYAKQVFAGSKPYNLELGYRLEI